MTIICHYKASTVQGFIKNSCLHQVVLPFLQAGFGTSPTSTWTPPTTWFQTPPRCVSPPKEPPRSKPARTETSCVTRPTASSNQPSHTWHSSSNHRTLSYGPGMYSDEGSNIMEWCCASTVKCDLSEYGENVDTCVYKVIGIWNESASIRLYVCCFLQLYFGPS